MPHILIVEDESIIRSSLKRLLERNGYNVSEAASVKEALPLLESCTPDLVISDLRLPGLPGTEMIKLAKDIPVLIMTSYASLRSAVDSMKLGAIDYIAKPFEHDDMLQCVARILQERAAQQKTTAALASTTQASANELGIIGKSPNMVALYSKIRKVAPTDSNVLILGESGTGKELVAQAIHRLSTRAQAPMICVNCAAIPESLIESELFGHEKGAFTGAERARAGLIEAADGGTLFLDEIGELPLEAQARLLRVLQEGEIRRVGSVQSKKVNIRLIAATHRDLKARAATGEFREDLFYRLHVIALQLPALRERGSDILEIAQALLAQQSARLQHSPLHFSEEACKAMLSYPWPGNVRELENAIERAVILCEGDTISTDLLGIDVQLTQQKSSSDVDASASKLDPSMEGYFQRFVLENQDSMTETELAAKLGISRKNLWERRNKLGIPRKKTSKSNN